MTRCPDPSTLERLFQGSLAPAERAAVEAHIDGCPGCSATLAELARLFGSATWSGAAGPGPARSTVETVAATGRAGPAWTGAPDLGRYRLGRRLGSGGMGMVFEAEDLELHRRVALKILHADAGADIGRTRARLLREARAMAQTNHPNIVAVYDVGRIAGSDGRDGAGEQVFLAMELVEGPTLTAWLRGRGRAEILAAFVMAGRGLAAAHANGLVHRDFKPDNVLIGGDGRARVTDFGLALAARPGVGDEPGPGPVDVRASLQIRTAHGTIVGTPAYMAPEQWRGQPADARTDQFAFCVALHEALVGVRPFASDRLDELAHAVLHEAPRPATPLPRWLQAALLRGLARDPAARFASMRELLAVLERDRVGPRRVLLAVGGMALVAALAGGAFAWATRPESAPEQAPMAAPEPVRAPTVAPAVAAPGACEGTREAGGRWTAGRRASLQVHVRGMDDGEALAAALLPVLDGWATRWTGAAGRACAAPASELREAERGCLDAALERFEATLELAGSLAGFKVAGALLPAAHRLPELGRCHDPRWLELAPAAAPVELAGKVALLRRRLAAVEAGVDLEQWVAVRDAAADGVAAAEALGYSPLVIEARMASGRLEWLVEETDAAIAWFEAAAETAAATRDERALGLAALALGELLGAGQLRRDAARTWSTIASALADRLDDADLRGRARLAGARGLAAVGEHAEALRELDAAEPLLRAAHGEAHPWRVELELARAAASLATARLDDAERAAGAAERVALAVLGPQALLTARATAERARVALARGRHGEAERLATAASAIPGVGRSRRHDLDHGRYLGLLGDIALARAAPAAALERYREAEIFLYAGPESALPLLWQGVAHLRLGQRELAFRRIDAGWRRIDESWAADDLRRLDLLRLVGLAALEAGALGRARAALGRAVTLVEAVDVGALRARAQADLGRLERLAGHPREALGLLDASFVGMAGGLGQGHPEVVTVSLARADLAWELGDPAYARRLYGVIADDLVRQRGAGDPASLRAAARRSRG